MKENENSDKKVKKSFWIGFLYSEFIVEFLLIMIIHTIFTCSCGHHFIKPFPVLLAYILKIVIYKLIVKKCPELLKSHGFVWLLIILEVVTFIAVVALSGNDMEELHRIDKMV